MLDTFLPKVLAIVAVVEVELDRVLVEAVVLGVQFDEELFPLETQLSYFRPRERVYFREILKHQYAHVRHGQIELHAFVVLRRMHYDPVELNFARDVQQIEIGVRWRLAPFWGSTQKLKNSSSQQLTSPSTHKWFL